MLVMINPIFLSIFSTLYVITWNTITFLMQYNFFVLCLVFTLFVAIMFPFFGGLLGFFLSLKAYSSSFGGFAFCPTAYFVSIIFSITVARHFSFLFHTFRFIYVLLLLSTFIVFPLIRVHILNSFPLPKLN